MEANLHSKFTTSHRVESGQMVGSDALLSLNLNMHVLFGVVGAAKRCAVQCKLKSCATVY